MLLDSPEGIVVAVVSSDSKVWESVEAELSGIEEIHAVYFKVSEGAVDFATFTIK